MFLILKCKACGHQMRYDVPEGQSLYEAAYVAGARHAKENSGQAECWVSAIRHLVLMDIGREPALRYPQEG